MGKNKRSEEYPISFSEGPCIATSGLVNSNKLRDKVNIGRRYQENLVFDFRHGRRIPARIFFFRDYFPQMYNFQAPSEVYPCASENY